MHFPGPLLPRQNESSCPRWREAAWQWGGPLQPPCPSARWALDIGRLLRPSPGCPQSSDDTSSTLARMLYGIAAKREKTSFQENHFSGAAKLQVQSSHRSNQQWRPQVPEGPIWQSVWWKVRNWQAGFEYYCNIFTKALLSMNHNLTQITVPDLWGWAWSR